jgi:hypothetical protein
MTPDQLRDLRLSCADRPAHAALVELTLLYEATAGQIAALTVGDVRPTAVNFVSSRPGVSGKTAVRLVPDVAARLAPLTADQPPTASLFDASVAEIDAALADLFEHVGATPPRPSGAESVLYMDASEFGVLRVVRDELGLWAMTDVLPQGVVYASGEPPAHVFLWTYLDALVPQNPRILLLGGGVFVGAQFLEERLEPDRLDVVEIDPRCPRVAEMYFGYRPGPTTEIHRTDAKRFVREVDLTWDAVIQDVADASGTLDWLTEPEHAAAVAARAPVLLANLITSLDSPLLEEVGRTLTAAGFTEVRRVPLRTWVDRDRAQNILVIATRPV